MKHCGNCQFCNLYKEVEPCNSCKELSNWKLVFWEKEQVQQIAEENECETCINKEKALSEEPCLSCDDDKLDKWEKATPELNKAMIHEYICQELTQTYKKKNNDYGDSFALLRNEYDNAILIRIFDKYNRLKTLMSGTQQQVNDESIADTLKDLANYAIMQLVEMEVDKCK